MLACVWPWYSAETVSDERVKGTTGSKQAQVPQRIGRGDLEVAPREHLDSARNPGISRVLRREIKAALARWVVQRQPAAERCTRPEDEASHPWTGDEHFSEEYIFAVVQPQFALFVRLEWLPGRDHHRVWIHVITPDRVWVLPGDGGAVERVGAGDHWRAAGLELDCQQPHQSWTLRYHGGLQPWGPRGEVIDEPCMRCGFELEFCAGAPPFIPGTDDHPKLVARHLAEADWDLDLLRTVRRRRIRGYTQAGTVVGTVSMGFAFVPLYASCLRVHTWGPRDWGASDTAFQVFGSLRSADQGGIGEEHSRRFWSHQAKFPWVTLEGGWVQTSEGLTAIEDIGITREQTPGRPVRRAGLTLVHAMGEWELEAEAVAHHSFDIDRRGRMTVTLARFSGEREGWGLWVTLQRTVPGQRKLTG